MSARQGREEEFWTPEPVFAGARVFCLASGPSLTAEVAARVRGRPALVVNSSWRLAPWAAAWFFTDNAVFERFRAEIEGYAGLVVTLSRRAKGAMPERIRRVRGQWMDGFPPAGADHIRQGRSSGHTAVSALVAMGAAEIVLLGFDMRVADGREHCHEDYAGQPRDLGIYGRDFLPAWAGWDAQALARGVRILNATPGSALMEFEAIELEAVLSW